MMVKKLRTVFVGILASLFMGSVVVAATPGAAQAAAGDTIIYHRTDSVLSSMILCKDWTSSSFTSTTCPSQQRVLYRGQYSTFWADTDGVWIPAGYDLYWDCCIVYSEKPYGYWAKIQGAATGTVTKALHYTY